MSLQKQTKAKPLFPDLLWSRPENKFHAGKLLSVGGNAQAALAPAQAYMLAQQAGAGTVKVLLPDALKKTVGKTLEDGEYAPSTPSGSFSTQALGELQAMANWADGTLIAGDIGRNSETAILLEKFLEKHVGQVTLTRDAIEYITALPSLVQHRPDTLAVLSYSQLQRLGTAMHFPMAFSFDITLQRLTDCLRALTEQYSFSVATQHLGQTFVGSGGQVSSTPIIGPENNPWRLAVATKASVLWLQNPGQLFASVSTSLVVD